ncbi:GNAT family N-acetyltransferase [Martelella mediterranea]|uniref:GNAT family N-acetyltransferase n=1 Tax=Martelella mediterranea TaxID=293089 RepID=UPI001E290E48|nr:GNAT family N-acetyltransferase [Martelella mediterranea]MCD1635068.1 GNAT family N-acetyltransferase [Martelella mediterranea]
MTATLRPASPADLSAITEIYAECVLNGVASYELEPPSREEMEARMTAITAAGYPYLAATEGDRVIGYAYASAFRTRPAYRWLVENSVYLSPEARGKGVGKSLLSQLVTECETRGFRQMVAVIGGASPASIALHTALGFTEAGRLTGTGFKHGKWLDTVFMQRPLGEGNRSDPLPLSL